MSIPATFVQILIGSGHVVDVSPEEWKLLQRQATGGAEWLEATDIYGAYCRLREQAIVCIRETSPDAEAAYRAAHAEEEGESWA